MPQGDLALVIGASGGIGSAFMGHLRENKQFSHVLGLSRSSHPALDLSSEATIAACAETIRQSSQVPRLIILATGLLHEGAIQPEKGWRDLNPDAMARLFTLNTIGPALVPDALCVSLHPGTVATRMSAPFTKSGLNSLSPEESALRLLQVIDQLSPAQTGGFFDYRGEALPW
ncbi:MAG: hypothetical protein EBY21_12425 [Alphaproteobacteria bacterium]|nr:hypothetical protein [Alphaproteobacteria bacterium]